MQDLHFIQEEPTLSFRCIRRKGALRYIASNKRGSLGSMTRFAPVSKRIPKLMLKLFSVIDFRVPRWIGLVEPLPVSEEFLMQSASLLGIPAERVGIYVGEPDARRKLVIADVADQSASVLKVAAGSGADEAIRREAEGGQLALGDGHWEGLVPDIRVCDPVCGRPAILIERIRGKQLTPDEFEEAFFGEESGFRNDGQVSHGGTKSTESLSIEEWLHENELLPEQNNAVSLVGSVRDILLKCRECGALDLRSPLGLVHGDFGPWNTIQAEGRVVCVDWEFSRADTPLVFDYAYAAWCYSELLGQKIDELEPGLWNRLVALGALWRELRQQL